MEGKQGEYYSGHEIGSNNCLNLRRSYLRSESENIGHTQKYKIQKRQYRGIQMDIKGKWKELRYSLRKIRQLEEEVALFKSSLLAEKLRNDRLEKHIREQERLIQYNYYSLLSPDKYPQELEKWYFKRTGKRLNLANPQTYNEKIQWFKLYGVTPQIRDLVDKYKVRSYVADIIGEEYLIPLLGVWNTPEEIDFSKLPDKFVIKANHGCRYNYIVRDKSKLNIADLYKKANQWLQEEYAFHSGFELQYLGIQRCLIAEEYMDNGDGNLNDFKFRCFNGKVRMLAFCSNRKDGLCMDFFDRDWNHLPIRYNDLPSRGAGIPRPDNLDEMIEIAERLAEGFAHVRIDLYRMNDGKILFGEMTFTPSSGAAKWDPPELDYELGQLFNVISE